MTPKDAADALRPSFHLLQMPADDRHHVKFVEAVAAELGVESTPFNLYQVGAALAGAKIEHDPIEYPKMLYSRQFPKDSIAATYHIRRDHVSTIVNNDEELDALGDGWVTDPTDLPARGDLPIYSATVRFHQMTDDERGLA